MKLLAGMAATGAALLAAGYGIYLGFEPDRGRFPLRGVDVSHHQGTIDWAALKTDGIAFAYIKASEGGDFGDPKFAENWRQAGRAGIARGAYHFFTLCRKGGEQARQFISVVPKSPGALPPAVDLEFGGNCAKRPSRAALQIELTKFLKAVEAHYRSKPILYVTRAFHDAYLRGAYPGYGFWARSIYLEPDFRNQSWVIWQFHERGRKPGIKGPVDLNVFRGGPKAFARWRVKGELVARSAGPAPK